MEKTTRPSDFVTLKTAQGSVSTIHIGTYNCPFGRVLLAASPEGLMHLWLDEDGRAISELRALYPQAQILQQASSHHDAALSHFTSSPQPLTLHVKGTPFQLSVWRALLDIALGRASSYKAVAAQIGKPKAYRAVGSAVGKNPIFFIIPCHRVLAHDGSLGGYFYGTEKKQAILNWEAVRR